MPCGHTIHRNCIKEMHEHHQYYCPLCSKSVCDMSKVWERYDMEIVATPMPEHYRDKMVTLPLLVYICGVIAPLMSTLLGLPYPANSVGNLPLGYINLNELLAIKLALSASAIGLHSGFGCWSIANADAAV